MALLLTNCNLIDCVTEGVRPGATVAVDEGRILSLSSGGDTTVASGNLRDEVVDLNGAYLLPGLWDVQILLALPSPNSPPGSARI